MGKSLGFPSEELYQKHGGFEERRSKFLNILLVSLFNDSISSRFLENFTMERTNSITTLS